MIELTKEHRERYSRQIAADGIGVDGQIKIMQSKILLIGLGGLGNGSYQQSHSLGLCENACRLY